MIILFFIILHFQTESSTKGIAGEKGKRREGEREGEREGRKG